MRVIFLLFRTYPLWGVTLALVFMQLAVFFTRRRSKTRFFFWGASIFLLLGVVAWIFFRGDLHSDTWVRTLFSLDQ